MRVAIVTESFLPQVNGVTNSVLRVLEHLRATGHEAIVIAPGARHPSEEIFEYAGFKVVSVPTIMVPLINSLPIGLPTAVLRHTLQTFRPDVVHLASPYVLGAAGAFIAKQLGIPAVAVYQTDIAGFSQRYHLKGLVQANWEWTRAFHNVCERTLAPSTPVIRELEEQGIRNLHRWGRGVDTVRFHPTKRSAELRRSWDPTGKKKIVGFIGRLAAEKGVDRLVSLSGDPRYQLVIVGSGPKLQELEELLPDAVFTGALMGEKLARAYASFDLFVHPGEFETFCQTIQEAQASGVPTIGPRAGGPIDLIQEGVNGELLDVSSFSRDLPAAVERVLAADLDPRASVAGRTWTGVCEQLMGHYEAVLAGSHSHSVV